MHSVTVLGNTDHIQCMNALENHYTHFFQHNNMTINELVQKERYKLFELMYDLQQHHTRA